MHHLAFAVEDIEKSISEKEKEGFALINPQPKEGADNKVIAFLHPKSTHGVLIELCQEKVSGDCPGRTECGCSALAFSFPPGCRSTVWGTRMRPKAPWPIKGTQRSSSSHSFLTYIRNKIGNCHQTRISFIFAGSTNGKRGLTTVTTWLERGWK